MPLELPAIDSQQVSLPPAAEGVAAPKALTEEEQKKMESVGWRMLNLPLIVCHSANGMPFFFPLQKVSPTTPSPPAFQSALHATCQKPLRPMHHFCTAVHLPRVRNSTSAFLGSTPLYLAGCALISLYSTAGSPQVVPCKLQPSFSRLFQNQPASLDTNPSFKIEDRTRDSLSCYTNQHKVLDLIH